MGRLFGAGGIRGVANLDLTPELAFKVGRAASHVLARDGSRFIIGRDTRVSGEMLEAALVAAICSTGSPVLPAGVLPTPGVGRPEELPDAVESYADFVASFATVSPAGLRVVVDCAHGAACPVAPLVWERLGATVIPINADPDGSRINVDCGSTSPEVVRGAVLQHGADIGVAHDGDADRHIVVDETGRSEKGD